MAQRKKRCVGIHLSYNHVWCARLPHSKPQSNQRRWHSTSKNGASDAQRLPCARALQCCRSPSSISVTIMFTHPSWGISVTGQWVRQLAAVVGWEAGPCQGSVQPRCVREAVAYSAATQGIYNCKPTAAARYRIGHTYILGYRAYYIVRTNICNTRAWDMTSASEST